MHFFGIPVRSFNLEITNRCVLACPECARTGNPWVKENLGDLPVSLLERIFPISRRERFQGLGINLCGAYGDCIYHRQFHDVIRHLKAAGLNLMVETNGSHRKREWWETTCGLLDENDVITFSVDGLEDTNHIYRINARWNDIQEAMRTCAERVTVSWKFIVFRHNEHQIEAARNLAREIGVRDITFKKSARFRQRDPLAPENGDYIGVVTRNRRQIQRLKDQGVTGDKFDRQVSIRRKCLSGKDLAITALGYLYPCTSCETSDRGSWFYRNRAHFDLRRHTIGEILSAPKWRELEVLWARASTAPASCLAYCGVHRDHDAAYDREARPDCPDKPRDAVRVELVA
jgi:MoaA/NifB/PqqE/SkfB family radical SAM enzyme